MKIALIKYWDRVIGRLLVTCLLRPRKVVDSSNRTILFIRPGGIGDAVLLVPVIRFLMSASPDVKLDVLAERRNSHIFTLSQGIRHVYCYDRFAEFGEVLRSRYDVVIDTEQWHHLSAVIARLIRSQRKVGFATNKRMRMFTDGIEYSHDDYEATSFQRLLRPLLPEIDERIAVEPYLEIPASVKSSSELLGDMDRPYVVLFPGASVEERRWGTWRFTDLAARLIADGYQVVLVGGSEDIEGGGEIAAGSAALNMTGKTSLPETASILKGATLLVSGDSGVLHIGVGLGVPTVSLFGPGIAKKWAPRGELHRVINLELPCSPCTRFGTTPPCPIGAKCIQDISVEQVYAAVQDLLSQITKGA